MPHQTRRLWWYPALALFVLAYFVTMLCDHKIADRDLWWHLRSGEIMLETREMIRTEPFAYPRMGRPYVTTHEWLGQVFLALVYRFGPEALMMLKALMIWLAYAIVLAIDRRRIHVNAALAVFAAAVTQSMLFERPALFTFLFFALYTAAMVHALGSGLTKKTAWLVAAQVLWVNLHGAACVLGLFPVAAYAAQRLFERRFDEVKKASVLAASLLAASLLSPDHWHNFTLIASVYTSGITRLVLEWLPRDLPAFLREQGPLLAAALAALLWSRKQPVFFLLLLALTGYLSRQAVRHEPLLALASLATVVHQLRDNARWRDAWERGIQKKWLGWLLAAAVFAGLWAYSRAQYEDFVRRDHLYGRGEFSMAEGAFDFIEREAIRGTMFNSYPIGSYLVWRGYPDRPVYIDGRTADHGYDFLKEALWSGQRAVEWRKLEAKYGFTYAIIDYASQREGTHLPYTDHLDAYPDWKLVYVDDWAAVYLKDTPDNAEPIRRYAYSVISPRTLEFEEIRKKPADEDEFPDELRRAASQDARSVKARLLLARILIGRGQMEEALRHITAARAAQPYRAEVYGVMASWFEKREMWKEAAAELKKMIRYADPEVLKHVDKAYLRGIFEKARE